MRVMSGDAGIDDEMICDHGWGMVRGCSSLPVADIKGARIVQRRNDSLQGMEPTQIWLLAIPVIQGNTKAQKALVPCSREVDNGGTGTICHD